MSCPKDVYTSNLLLWDSFALQRWYYPLKSLGQTTLCHFPYLERLKDLTYQAVDVGILVYSSLVVKYGENASAHAFQTPMGWSGILQSFEEELLEKFSDMEITKRHKMYTLLHT